MNDLNNTINSTEQVLETSFLYENCSEKLTRLNRASPAQEYFQYFIFSFAFFIQPNLFFFVLVYKFIDLNQNEILVWLV
jgi:hypothetical protein